VAAALVLVVEPQLLLVPVLPLVVVPLSLVSRLLTLDEPLPEAPPCPASAGLFS
jgi:hypothetical protein